MIYRMLILFQMIGCCGCLCAQSAVDSVRVYFRRGYSVLDLSLRDNRQTLDAFVGRLDSLLGDTSRHIVSLCVEGNASPDGTLGANRRLSGNRAKRVLEYIRLRVALPDSLVRVVAGGIDWDGLAERIAADPRVPARGRALDILHHTPVWVFDNSGRIVDSRKKQLMDLDGGRTYRYLLEHFFPGLRNASLRLSYTVTSVVRPEEKPAGVPEPEPESGPAVPSSGTDSLPSREAVPEPSSGSASGHAEPEEREPLHRLALKTNLLYDAVLMPSLEVEYRIDDRWSVNLEGEVAWWSKKDRHKYYQIATIGPEGRYWFRTRKPWHGHYVGAFVGGSWYDLENGGRGYKGELVMTGLSYGYMFPIGRSLSLETGIGIGFLHTSYEEYLPVDGHYVYQQTSRTNYFGPVKLRLSLAWRLWDRNRKGGAR